MGRKCLHSSVVRKILSLITSGVYKDGYRLPSERKLCDVFDVSRGTVRAALADLVKAGIIKVKHGSGAYVQCNVKLKSSSMENFYESKLSEKDEYIVMEEAVR